MFTNKVMSLDAASELIAKEIDDRNGVTLWEGGDPLLLDDIARLSVNWGRGGTPQYILFKEGWRQLVGDVLSGVNLKRHREKFGDVLVDLIIAYGDHYVFRAKVTR